MLARRWPLRLPPMARKPKDPDKVGRIKQFIETYKVTA